MSTYAAIIVRQYAEGRICITSDRIGGYLSNDGGSISLWRNLMEWTGQRFSSETIRIGIINSSNIPYKANMEMLIPISFQEINPNTITYGDISAFDILYFIGLPSESSISLETAISNYVKNGGGVYIEVPDIVGEIEILKSIESVSCDSINRPLFSNAYWTENGKLHYSYIEPVNVGFLTTLDVSSFSSSWIPLMTNEISTLQEVNPEVTIITTDKTASEFGIGYTIAMKDGIVEIEPDMSTSSSSSLDSSSSSSSNELVLWDFCDNIVAYWKMDENNNSPIVWDESHNFQNMGVLKNNNSDIATSSRHVEGIINGSLSFNGSSINIKTNPNTVLNFNGAPNDLPLTVSFWVYPKSYFGYIMSKNGVWEIYLSFASIYMTFFSPSGYRTYNISGLTIPLYEWTNVTFSYNGLFSGMSIYRNGVLINQISDQSGYTTMNNLNSEFYFAYKSPSGAYFDGYIDNVFVLNKSINAIEAEVLWNNGKGTENCSGIYTYSSSSSSSSGEDIVEFRVTYLTGVTPANLVLNYRYAGPANAAIALYDAGDGVWKSYTSKTIPIVGSYVAFKGDWRTAGGVYAYMFRSTFNSAAYTCKFSGALLHTPTTFFECYYEIFRDCTAVTAIEDNPLPILTGTPAEGMFSSACEGMSGVTALPTGFLDTSGLTGSPADYMFSSACYDMTGVTALPTGFMNTSGLTGAPADYMFSFACYGMSGVTGALPTGFLDTSGLTGAPAGGMFSRACSGMTGVTGALPTGFLNTAGLTGSPADYMFLSACEGMSGVTALPTGFLDTSGLTGAPALSMFNLACDGMSSVTTLPTGFMNTSGLTGAPGASMFRNACQGMSGVTALPTGFMDTSGLTGAPAVSMFYFACYNMTGVTALPTGFLDMSGLTGAPAATMFNQACRNMSGVSNAYTFTISSNVTFTSANVGTSATAGTLASAWRGMTNWPGTVMWGTNVLFSAITPNSLIRSIDSSTNIPGYDGFDTKWKAGDDLSSSSSSSSLSNSSSSSIDSSSSSSSSS